MYRNTIEQGSRFYNPLKQTLQKSRVQGSTSPLAKSRVYDQIGFPSRISKRMRSLSPQQVDQITRETIVTEDKELVPTNNLWKVRGKQFTAVNVNVRQGKPVPPQMIMNKFANTRNGFITSETLYEMRPRHSHRSLNTSFRPGPTLRLQSPPPSVVSSISQPYISPASIYYANKPLQNPVPRVASPVRLRQNPLILKEPQKLQNDFKLEERPLTTSSPSVQLDRISTKFKPAKKSEYKYNLFSSLDEAVNTGCGSCGGNEVIASKPNSYWD